MNINTDYFKIKTDAKVPQFVHAASLSSLFLMKKGVSKSLVQSDGEKIRRKMTKGKRLFLSSLALQTERPFSIGHST